MEPAAAMELALMVVVPLMLMDASERAAPRAMP